MAYSSEINKMDIEEVKSSNYQLQNVKRHSTRNRPHCAFCNNHGRKEMKQNHKCLFEKECLCALCTLTRKAQTLMKHQQRVWRFKNQINKVSEVERYQKCDNCRNHQKFVRKSNHDCPRENCSCELCTLSGQRRKVMKHLQRARRLGVTQDSTCDTDISVAVNKLSIEESNEIQENKTFKIKSLAVASDKETTDKGKYGKKFFKSPKSKSPSKIQSGIQTEKTNMANYDNLIASNAHEDGGSTSKENDREPILAPGVSVEKDQADYLERGNSPPPITQLRSWQVPRITDSLTSEFRDGNRHGNHSGSASENIFAADTICSNVTQEYKKEDNYLSFISNVPNADTRDAREFLTTARHYPSLNSNLTLPLTPSRRNDVTSSIRSLVKPIPLLGAPPIAPYWPPIFSMPPLVPTAQDYYHSLLQSYLTTFPFQRSPPW